MPRNASGDFTLPTNDSSPAEPRNVIRSSDFNELMADLSAGLTDSLSRSGDGGMQAALDMGGFAVNNSSNLVENADIGVNVQAYDADLTAIAALTSAANKVPYSTGAGTWALADFTAAGRALLDDADAAAQRGTLSLSEMVQVQWYGAVDKTGATSSQTAVAAAVADAFTNGYDLYWPAGTYLTTASIPNFHSVRHYGPGVVKRGTNLWYITPPSFDEINHIYAAASGGSSANDGLSASQPIDTFQHAIDALENWAPLEKGQWQIDLAAGTYARGRFPDEGLPSSYPIIIAGPTVAIGPGVGARMSLSSQTGTFTLGESVTFSPSGATATSVSGGPGTQRYLSAGNITSGTPSVGDTVTGTTSGATGVVEYIAPLPKAEIREGATEAEVGILGFSTSLRVKNIEIEDYNGSTSSCGIRVDNWSVLYLENVHLVDCYYGAAVLNNSKLDVKGGFVYDCGYLNSTTGGGFGYRLLFHSKAEIGTQSAGNLASGPAIKGCSGTVRMQELCTGHLDWTLQHDNDAGARLLVNSRLNVDGSSFKRNTTSAIYCTQGSHVDPTSSTVFGTGSDANGADYSIGAASTSSGAAITGISTANAADLRSVKADFPGTVVTSTGSTNTIDSLTLEGGVFANTLFSGIPAKKVKCIVRGTLTGTTGTYKRVALRLGAAGVVTLSFVGSEVGAFEVELGIQFTGSATQFGFAKGIVAAGTAGRIVNAALTESTTADITLALQAYVQNAADSITISSYEWFVQGV